MPRTGHLVVAVLALFACAGARGTQSEDYPARPVRIVVGFPAGAAGDLVSRAVAVHLGNALGQQFVVENRPGASSNIATEYAARAPKDGYTLVPWDGRKCGQRGGLLQPVVQFRQGFCADRADRDRAGRAGRASLAWGQQRAGADRACEIEARPVELCVVRRRHHAASGRRAAQRARRHQARARALSGQLAGDHRPAGRAHADHVLAGLGGPAAHQGGHAQGAGLGRAQARRAFCPICRRWPRSACPSSTPASGSA